MDSSKTIRRIKLEALLDPDQNPQIEKFEWKTIQTGKGNQYSRDPTVQQFLEGSALDPPVADKRQRIDLAGPGPKSAAKRRDIQSCSGRATQPTPPTLRDSLRERVPRQLQTRRLAPPRAAVLPVAAAPRRLPARGPPRPAPRQTPTSGAA